MVSKREYITQNVLKDSDIDVSIHLSIPYTEISSSDTI